MALTSHFSQAEIELLDPSASGAAPTPLAQYYARNPAAAAAQQPKLKDQELEYPRVIPVMRNNFKK